MQVDTQFNAIVVDRDEESGKTQGQFRQISFDDLPDQDVLVDVAFSTLNYKDALAVTGTSKICRQVPMVCGIDLAGVVAESRSEHWQKGDKVIVNGFGLSEVHWGGYSQHQRVSSEWLVKLPEEFTLEQAMGIGTAGYTAMLCVNAIRDHGVQPDDGQILVTGASGGVGSISCLLLAALGYQTVAVSGRPETADYLASLGAVDVISRAEFDRDAKPLETERWIAAIDSVGSKTLATILAQTKYQGVVTACGLAGGFDLPSSVMPFILRSVTLRGIDSVMAPLAQRQRAWEDLAKLIDPAKMAKVYSVKPMSELPELATKLLNGNLVGRTVIDVNA